MLPPIDTVAYYQTPEGVELKMRVAGPLIRSVAWLIDLFIRCLIFILLAVVWQFFDKVGGMFFLISIFLMEWFYPVLFEVFKGATPGKQFLGLCVVHDDGSPPGWSASLLRNFLRCIDFLPLGNLLGIFVMCSNRRFMRLGDLAAGTLVVYRDEENRQLSLPDVVSRPCPVPLLLAEQRHIVDFCERSQKLSAARQDELAALLSPACEVTSGKESLFAYGNWFAGRKGQPG